MINFFCLVRMTFAGTNFGEKPVVCDDVTFYVHLRWRSVDLWRNFERLLIAL